MPLAPGSRLGSSEIVGSLGAGGMGEVYRGRDARLNRDVAIKVIAQIHGVLEHPSALMMECVEGEDLAQRICRGAIALDDALPIARQIADALEAAHERGIVHRDLKPANVAEEIVFPSVPAPAGRMA